MYVSIIITFNISAIVAHVSTSLLIIDKSLNNFKTIVKQFR